MERVRKRRPKEREGKEKVIESPSVDKDGNRGAKRKEREKRVYC